jgi:hypothetical protein
MTEVLTAIGAQLVIALLIALITAAVRRIFAPLASSRKPVRPSGCHRGQVAGAAAFWVGAVVTMS